MAASLMLRSTPSIALPARITTTTTRRSTVAVRAVARPTSTSIVKSTAVTKPAAAAAVVSDASASAAQLLAAFPVLGLLAMPEAAEAAVSPVASAAAAYGHYLGLVLIVASLVTEKLLVKAEMSEEDAKKLVIADSLYGVAGVLVLYTGYLRITQYGKGWEFYQHEPIFWVKMALFAVMGSSSLFVTTKVVQMAIKQSKGEQAQLGEKLAARMQKIINGELLAIASIPLAASLMARGVAYQDTMPWQAGAAPVALISVGLGVKYVKEALTWVDEDVKVVEKA